MASKIIAQYRALLAINKHRLDEELEVQSDIQERISNEVARLNTRMLEMKDELAKTEARCAEQIKDREEKLTVDAIKGKVLRAPERLEAWRRYQEAREELEVGQGLLDAWRKRGFDITNLGGLYSSQYFSVRSAGAARPLVRHPREGRDERAARLAEDSVREAAPEMLPRRRRREE